MLPKRFVVAAICAAGMLFVSATSQTLGQTFPIKKRKKNIPGQRALVFDERLSALRTQPDIKAPLIMRLHREREVGIIGPPRRRNDGPDFYPVAVSRNVRGWIIGEALARPQRMQDATRLLSLIEDTPDDFTRARLARLCADQYRGTSVAPRALLKLGQAAEQAAAKLARDARRRVGEAEEEPQQNLSQRDYLLNYVGLDRYNKLGITFDYDEASQRLIYDGTAYRQIIAKYPRSAEATEARTRLGKLQPQLNQLSQPSSATQKK